MGVLKREQCPQCLDSSRDNLVTHSDDSVYCYGCGYRPDAEDDTVEVEGLISPGSIMELKARKLSKKTCEKYGITATKYTGYLKGEFREAHPVVVFNHFSEGQIRKQKIRDIKDRSLCTIKGDTRHNHLFGMHAFNPSDKFFITITEGEFDAAAVHEATGYAAVSVGNGAQGAAKNVKDNLEWLLKWKHVVINFDNDEPGRKAAEECLKLFEPGKARLCFFPLKDANDMLFANREQEIKVLLWQAEEFFPEDLVTASSVRDRIMTRVVQGASWPFAAMTVNTHGFRGGDIYIVAAGTSVGKSEFVKELILHQIYENNIVCGMFSFEQSAEDTFRRIIGGALNKPIHIPGVEYSDKELGEKIDELENKLYVFDRRVARESLLDFDGICNKIKVLARAKDVKLFVIDNLKAISATLDDPIRGIEQVMVKLQALAASLDVTFLVVSHLAKDKKISRAGQADESWGTGRAPNLENIYGSSAIEAIADYVFALSRNADSEDDLEQKNTRVQCLKARLDGTQRGKSFYLTYDAQTGRLNEEK